MTHDDVGRVLKGFYLVWYFGILQFCLLTHSLGSKKGVKLKEGI